MNPYNMYGMNPMMMGGMNPNVYGTNPTMMQGGMNLNPMMMCMNPNMYGMSGMNPMMCGMNPMMQGGMMGLGTNGQPIALHEVPKEILLGSNPGMNKANGINSAQVMENPNASIEVVLDDLALVDLDEAQELVTFSEAVLGATETNLPTVQTPPAPAVEKVNSHLPLFDKLDDKDRPEPIFMTTFSSDLGGGSTSPMNESSGDLGTTRNLQMQIEKKGILQFAEPLQKTLASLVSAFAILRQLKIDAGTLLNENSPEFHRYKKQSQEALTSLPPLAVDIQNFKLVVGPETFRDKALELLTQATTEGVYFWKMTNESLTTEDKVTTDELRKFAGTSFTMVAEENVLSFHHVAGDKVELTINGTVTESLNGGVHLDLSPMACCIGDACVMWPEKPEGFQIPEAPKWSFDVIELNCPGPFEVDGKRVDVDELKVLAGTSFGLWAGEDHIAFEDLGEGSVRMILNGEAMKVFDHPLHLNINPMAVCIGDECMMWPSNKLTKTGPASQAKTAKMAVEPNKEENEDEFLASIKEKLGADYEKLLRVLSKKPSGTLPPKHAVRHGNLPELKTKEDWDVAITNAGQKPVVVDCSAVWCAPCKVIAPKYEEFSKQFGDKVNFYVLDIQVNTYVAEEFEIGSLPLFLFVKDKKVVARHVGSDAEELRSKIEALCVGLFGFILIFSAKGSLVAETEETKADRASHYDYIVIGGGSGGMASAKEAAKHGAKVAVFDYVKPSTQNTRWGLGGTCVNVGCVPKKLMHYAALCGEQLHDAQTFGWNLDLATHDWTTLVRTVQAHVKKLNFFYQKGLDSANMKTLRPDKPGEEAKQVEISNGKITYFNALAEFSGPKEVSWTDDFGGSGKITGDTILIAVGGRPTVTNTPGVREYAITSDDIFSRERAPGKTLCVGAGYISLECGGFLSNLGYDTTIAVRSVPLRVGPFDRQCVDKLVSLMELQGTRFLYKVEVESIIKLDSGRLLVTFQNVMTKETSTEEFDTVLYATGRHADTSKLGLAAAGVKTSEWGTIDATDKDETNVPGIYAIGDVVTGRPELTPVAVQAGELLARRLFAKSEEVMDYVNIPTTVFTPFEYGLCGLSEDDAIHKYGAENINVYLSAFQSLELGAAHRKTHPRSGEPEDFPANALSKLVCNKADNDRVVGFHYVGPNAGEVTQGFALGLRLGATKKDFTDLVGIHPTDAESFCALNITKVSREEYESVGGCGGGKCG